MWHPFRIPGERGESKLQTAASGFKSQGQFIALHVSHNLNIPFDQLKTDMMTKHDSLGAAIRNLRPDLDSKKVTNNVKLAERQAKRDLQESNEIAQVQRQISAPFRWGLMPLGKRPEPSGVNLAETIRPGLVSPALSYTGLGLL